MRIWHLGKDSRRQEELTFWKSVVMASRLLLLLLSLAAALLCD